MSEITIKKSTLSQTDVEMDLSIVTQTIIVNNNGIYDSIYDD